MDVTGKMGKRILPPGDGASNREWLECEHGYDRRPDPRTISTRRTEIVEDGVNGDDPEIER